MHLLVATSSYGTVSVPDFGTSIKLAEVVSGSQSLLNNGTYLSGSLFSYQARAFQMSGTISLSGSTTTVGPLTVSNSLIYGTVTKTSAYAVTVNDNLVFLDSTGGIFNVTLPTPSVGRVIVLKRNNSGGANAITVLPHAAETIDGNANYLLNTSVVCSVTLTSDGTNWYIIAKVT